MALFESVASRKVIKGQLIWFTSWLFITIVGLSLSPDPTGHGTHQHLGLPPCPSVLLFDRPCPGCGLTTSWTALLHGNFALAFAAHPIGPLMYVMFTLSAFACLYGYVKQMRFDSDIRPINLATKAFLAVFVAFGVGRFLLEPNFATQHEKVLAQFVTGRK